MKMSKNDELYTKLMDQLEIIHSENLFIMQALLVHSGIPKEKTEEYAKSWDERFQEERRNW